jgi:uncharacterized protein YjbI with pentapeptide repeats
MTAEELLQRYAAGERDFSGVDLENISLRGANLSEIDLSNACLVKVDLTRANLTNANLSGVSFTQVSLFGADIAGVNLTDVDLRNTTGFDFSSLMGSSLLWRTTLPDGTVITDKVFTEE